MFASVVAMAAATVTIPPATAAATPAEVPGAGTTQPGQAASLPVTLDGVGPGPHTVTLVTGDTVTLTAVGRGYEVDVDAAPRPDGATEPDFTTEAGPDGVFVIPEDVRDAVESGRLDRGLFDVEYLIENGYTDDQSTAVPVIVQYPRGLRAASAQAAADALPASQATADLSSIHAAAVSVPKAQAAQFFASVRPAGSAGSAGRAGSGPSVLSSGIARVWLDRKVEADLSESVPLIGAPTAWQAGLDGRGVKVAILDTGIDDTHPDLAGKVVEARSFVPDTPVTDRHGHGTHVASTVVGSGAASDGTYRGVAPGADLVIGKVLNDGGSGQISWTIDGMEWAAASGARIVSMSLGASPTDGTAPQDLAVNELTASTGTLFVIAAGNSGPDAETVASPGSAEAALTVAATDNSDALASFSSRGPRLDGALKPDLAAPGVRIVAARAAGTNLPGSVPVGEFYTTLSGTSMATPHVSGAAAILAQAHPDWTAPQLKAALMSTATDAGHAVYEQGAGRLDVARAVTQDVFAATANLDFMTMEATDPPASRELSYANTGEQPVTLALSPRLRGPDGATVEGVLTTPDTVTVPAHATATVTVGLDAGGLPEGRYSGAVVAEAGSVHLTTPVGLLREPPKVPLDVHIILADGQPARSGRISVIDVSGDRGAMRVNVVDGVARAHVPPGVYSVSDTEGWVDEADRRNEALLLDPEVVVNGPTEITLDVRKAQPYSFTTPKPSEISHTIFGTTQTWQRTNESGHTWASLSSGISTSIRRVTPTRPVTKGGFLTAAGFRLGRPEVAMRVPAAGMDLHPTLFIHDLTHYDTGHDFVPFHDADLTLVDVGTGTPEDLAGKDVRGKLALLDVDGGCAIAISRFQAVRDAGAAAVVAWLSNPTNGCFPRARVPLWMGGEAAESPLLIPYASLPATEAGALRELLTAGPVTVDVDGGPPQSPYVYELSPIFTRQVPDPVHLTLTEQDLARIDTDMHGDEPDVFEESSISYRMDQFFVTSVHHQLFAGPGSRTTYLGPLYSDVLRERRVVFGGGSGRGSVYGVFDRPTHTHQVWNAVPGSLGAARPSAAVNALADPDKELGEQNFLVFCEMCRSGDFLYPSYARVSGDHTYEAFQVPGPGQVHLYRGDQEIAAEIPPGSPFPAFRLPKEPADYRMTVTDPRSRSTAEWTFRSETVSSSRVLPGHFCLGYLVSPSTPCRPEAMVFADYDLGGSLRMDNSVDPRGTHRFSVTAYHSQSRDPMPAIAGVKVWTSTDGGAHWTRATLKSTGKGTYRVSAKYRTRTGKVSLKVQAWDTAGNQVVQTTLDAFALRTGHRPGSSAI